MTKKIRPHKGGRSENLTLRLTPAEKKDLQEMANLLEMSLADMIIMHLGKQRIYKSKCYPGSTN